MRARQPRSWAAFAAGDLDAVRVRLIHPFWSDAAPEALRELLEERAPGYAADHTVADTPGVATTLRPPRLDPQTFEQTAARAVADRRVEISHRGDGTSWFNALLPTGVAIAITRRLKRAARALPACHVDPDPETGDTGVADPRTLEQKKADLVGHWLTSSTGTETDIAAEIAIAISATDLVGLGDGPGTTRDGGEPLPAEWVRDLAGSATTVFRRLALDPAGQVLDTLEERAVRAAPTWATNPPAPCARRRGGETGSAGSPAAPPPWSTPTSTTTRPTTAADPPARGTRDTSADGTTG